MQIAVMSDTHDNIWKLEEALPHLAQADVVLHCGDLCAPFVVKQIGDASGEIPVHIVWGNNDGDPFTISKVAQRYANIHLHGALAELDLGQARVAINHYPEIARGLALSGLYDLVCYGHDHTAHEERLGGCLLLNPGEVMGMNGRSSLALVDGETWQVTWVELGAA
jgi:putative phosphoesterase